MTKEDTIFPKFNTDLLLRVENQFIKSYADKILINKLEGINIIIEVQEIDRENIYSNREWIPSSSFINLYLKDAFIDYHFNKSTSDLKIFLENLKVLIKLVTKIKDIMNDSDNIKRTRPFTGFSTFYKSKDNFVFHFLFEVESNEDDYISALFDVFKTINKYNEANKNDFQTAIKESCVKNNKIKYLLYFNGEWNVLNPLLEVSKEINYKYRKDKDFRIKKPHILIHRDDYKKYFALDYNWVLFIDKLETLLIKPNDVSLYSNISDTNLKKAKDFYSKTILPRFKYYGGSFPSIEKQQEYYDYFELVISALIFSYTSLEAFANICIPDQYEYMIEKNGIKTIYSKQAIERNFSLREKFKKILRYILNTPDITQKDWWNSFIELEKIRNNIIHTKQSKSKNRYSQLLSKKIFDIIEVHKDIIQFYGFYISKNKKELLEEFPYNFGYDNFLPSLITDEYYEEMDHALYNPSAKKVEKNSKE